VDLATDRDEVDGRSKVVVGALESQEVDDRCRVEVIHEDTELVEIADVTVCKLEAEGTVSRCRAGGRERRTVKHERTIAASDDCPDSLERCSGLRSQRLFFLDLEQLV
jgi:hypothetical protein